MTKQHQNWTSDKSFNNSMIAYTRQKEETPEQKEERLRQLKNRQFKLRTLFTSEAAQIEKELKTLRVNGRDNTKSVDFLKQRIDVIRSAREDERKKEAEEKMYQHWRENNPEIRQIESKQFEKYVSDKWNEQMYEKEAALKMIESEDNEYAKYLELERQKAEDLDLELKRLKLNREIELKEILKQQMIELKQREAESEVLNREEADLMQEQYHIYELNEKRNRTNEMFAKQQYGRTLLSQHKAKLRQKAQEIQEALELDLKILQMIAQVQDNQKHLELEKRLKAKSDAENMIQVLNQQLRLEKEREAELDSMFQDEAVKEYEKRSAEWERERQAREKLMRQVLDERQKQMEEKMIILQQKKRESLERREELIKDMEKTQALAIKEREKSNIMKMERKQDLETQITSRKENDFNENILKDVDEYEREQIKENEYKNFLQKETHKQTEAKFQPKVETILKFYNNKKISNLFFI